MIASPEIDAVAVVVRVPLTTRRPRRHSRRASTSTANGRSDGRRPRRWSLRHWLRPSGCVTAVGVQARVNPALMHMKEQVEAGFVGEVLAVHVSLLRDGVCPGHRTAPGSETSNSAPTR